MVSLSGLSGFDSESVILQLMAVERNPLNRLTAKRNSEESQLNLLLASQNLVNATRTSAQALSSPLLWRTTSTSSSDPSVSVRTTDASVGASVTLTIDSLASAKVLRSSSSFATLDTVASSGEVTLTLQQLVDSVNSSTPYRAEAVSDGVGGYLLQVSSTVSGSASTVDMSAFSVDGGTTVFQEAADAQVTIGEGPSAVLRTSSTNVFTDVLTGSQVTVSALSAEPVEISATIGTADVNAVAARLSAMVSSLNTSLADITKHTGYDAVTRKSGELSREGGLRRAADQLRSSLFGSDRSPSTVGISIDRKGVISFNRDEFEAAFTENPDAVRDALTGTDGFATRVASTAASVAFGPTSVLGSSETSRRSAIRRIGLDMDSMTSRLEKREQTLRSQFTQLEMVLRRLQSQSDWLTSQVSALNGMNRR